MMMNAASLVTLAVAAAVVCIQTPPVDAFVARVPGTTKIASFPSLQPERSSIILHLSNEKSPSSSTGNIVSSIYGGIAINDKIDLRDPTPEERGKGGVRVVDNDGIKALEVLARIPRNLILSSAVDKMSSTVMEAVSGARNITWATELTAVTVAALHNDEEDINTKTKKEWIQSWQTGGWGVPSDLGPDISNDIVGTSLLTTGSDNDHNIYAKFRMPCHPALFKASMGLKLLTQCTEDEARKALYARGDVYRGMRDSLQSLVVTSTLEHDKSIKGTLREKRCWDVADALNKVLARATTLTLEEDDNTVAAIVPIHERLGHALNGGNTKLVSIDNEILLVATRDIEVGEEITRDYTLAPKLENDQSTVVGSALHLLLQFGLPPSAFPAV